MVKPDQGCLWNAATYVQSPAPQSGLRIQRCCDFSSDQIPCLETPHIVGQPKKKKKMNEIIGRDMSQISVSQGTGASRQAPLPGPDSLDLGRSDGL